MDRAYWDGLGVLRDDEKSEEWFRRSAAIGNVKSQYTLGNLLQEQGRLSEAVTWYERACESGSQYAQYSLGKMYLLGNGVPKDIEKAVQLLSKSAVQGNAPAQFPLNHRRHDPSVLLCTARLFHHMSKSFWETLLPPRQCSHKGINKKRKIDKGKKENIRLVITGENTAKALDAAKKPLNLIALFV